MSKANIRIANQADLAAIKDIIVAAWDGRSEDHLMEKKYGVIENVPWQQRMIASVLGGIAEDFSNIFVAEFNGRVAGFAMYSVDDKNKTGIVGYNAVHPDMWGQGIGSVQIENILGIFRQKGLKYAKVMTGLDELHAGARRTYEKFGFTPLATYVAYSMNL
ncbi:MAG: GNAT family N-acetyltransferase [Verrucomicrobia bacterium]|nr:GNAT family N-acetyltransferase [Verrucomicrobiota bacterium]MBU4247901.1 GNAT family N-acetyltransferase [Verrucomicrobiota bacterium]MBU4291279.1 GNAT family N-acetyltransferase [Verrucomicrobiota bacterium]MBU4496763.1 GNAT family N-acetyltransferase [Verrucomicrobiota bacterium]MCG2679167.1 GNAT family N-acetyltransferase [Kiritimatiellia bacterium]